MKHRHHIAICAGLVAVAIVLIAAGRGRGRVYRPTRLRADDGHDDLGDGPTRRTRRRPRA